MEKQYLRVSAAFGITVLVLLAATPLLGQPRPQQNSAATTMPLQTDDPRNLGLLAPMAVLRDFRGKRASSWDRSGGNLDFITIGKRTCSTLLTETGAGCVKHFYWGYIEGQRAPRMNIFRGLILRMYWDGGNMPSVQVPLGDFFGVTNGVVRPIRSLAFVTNPGATEADGSESQTSWGFNCYLPMPFAKGARVEIENTGDSDARIWYHIDYELYADGSSLPAGAGRLHACWHRENPTAAVHASPPNLTGKDNCVILDTAGNGQFVGYFLTVVNLKKGWWGEGDDMVFVDGEAFPPSYHGTGTEEIFGGGGAPNVEYTGPYTGFHCVENRGKHPWFGDNGMYRFYVNDPIRFRKSIRVTIEHGHANDQSNDYSSVAFWYQRDPK